MRITVVTPTIMRPSLRDTVKAVWDCLLPGDEHIIVRDAATNARDEGMLMELPVSPFTRYFEANIPGSRYGNGQRDCAIQMAAGDCIVYIDDDDLPGRAAFDVLHREEPNPDACHLFSMLNESTGRLFGTDDLSATNVGGPQLVVPNRKDLPKWLDANDYMSDFDVIQRTTQMPGMWVKHHPEIICYVSKQSYGN
jgi:glycosyltransferase involved in cell wall biosynthesis